MSKSVLVNRIMEMNYKLLRLLVEKMDKDRADYLVWDKKVELAKVELARYTERRDGIATKIHNSIVERNTMENVIEVFNRCKSLTINK